LILILILLQRRILQSLEHRLLTNKISPCMGKSKTHTVTQFRPNFSPWLCLPLWQWRC